MDPLEEQLEALRDIRNMMHRSKKFDHISGKAGIVVGILALVIVAITYWLLAISPVLRSVARRNLDRLSVCH